MARALRSEQMTPADELRDLLAASEKLIANVYGSGAGALELLNNMDRLSELWPQLEAGGVDLRPEAGRWETLQATTRRRGRQLVQELRAQGGTRALRAAQHPDGTAEWWWHLDEMVANDDGRRALRAGLIAAIVLIVGAGLYFLLRFLFPVDPNVQAAMERQAAGDLKIQQEGDFAGARVDFQTAVERLPGDADNWLRLGAAQEKLGDQAGMAESFRRARALFPNESEFEVSRGQIYFILGMWDEAKRAIEAALAADPENAMGYYVLASVEEARGHASEAVAALQRAADLAEAQNQMQLTALARYRMGMMMQQVQSQMAVATPVPTPTPKPN